MNIITSYSCRIVDHDCYSVLKATTELYRKAVGFFLEVYLAEHESFRGLRQLDSQRLMEGLTHKTAKRPVVKYDFDEAFYKFPSYYRRAAINAAIGIGSSYLSNLSNWENSDKKDKHPSKPCAGNVYPALYKDGSYVLDENDEYNIGIKVFVRNTWDWIYVPLRKSDVDYIHHHCGKRTLLVPSLRRRHKVWSLDFAFEEQVELNDTPITEQTILAVDLGVNSACTCCVMRSDGTILGRRTLHLPKEEDSLSHAFNRIKKAQQHGARKTPRLWALAKGINDHISVKTAEFIVAVATEFCVHTIVFENLNLCGKKRGRGKQRLHHWRAQYAQEMVGVKAHRLGMRISTVNAWGTSRLAFDGSGRVLRGKDAGLPSYSLCRFFSGKVYNCDLNASYNIGARFFIREILKSKPERVRMAIEVKVPQCAKRSTCTLSTLISLNAELSALSRAS